MAAPTGVATTDQVTRLYEIAAGYHSTHVVVVSEPRSQNTAIDRASASCVSNRTDSSRDLLDTGNRETISPLYYTT